MSLRAIQSAIWGHGRGIIVRYLIVAIVANLFWEAAQLPLYTIWRTASLGERVFAVAHCTAGDLMILATTVLATLLLVGGQEFPRRRYARVILAATVLGVAYTMFSEWVNVEIRRSWAYSTAMPTLPPFGTGLAPFLQWVLIPPVASVLANRWTRAETN